MDKIWIKKDKKKGKKLTRHRRNVAKNGPSKTKNALNMNQIQTDELTKKKDLKIESKRIQNCPHGL